KSEKLIWLMGGSDQVVRRFSHNRDLFGDSLGIEQAATYILPRRRLAHIDMNSQTTQMTTE
ncbi:hypothetical protein, partial [Pseudomonas savastanoi]|uniref:hypothetical protein n=1 Tax=Pseudomonas savastanoi TaxID=29438 RepID=UPI0005C7EEDC